MLLGHRFGSDFGERVGGISFFSGWWKRPSLKVRVNTQYIYQSFADITSSMISWLAHASAISISLINFMQSNTSAEGKKSARTLI